MGHFGKRPVRIAWFALVGPALVINYFGQGALLLELGKPVDHPLYYLVPATGLPWLVALATRPRSSHPRPRFRVRFPWRARRCAPGPAARGCGVLQTSGGLEHGHDLRADRQLAGVSRVIAFVVGFGSSDAWGALTAPRWSAPWVVTRSWARSSPPRSGTGRNGRWRAFFGLMLVNDCAFVAGNLTKVPPGDGFRLTLGAALCLIFTTWRSGRLELRAGAGELAVPRSELAKLVAGVHRVPGTGVFSRQQCQSGALGADPQHRAQQCRAPAPHHSQRRDRRHAWPHAGSARRVRKRTRRASSAPSHATPWQVGGARAAAGRCPHAIVPFQRPGHERRFED